MEGVPDPMTAWLCLPPRGAAAFTACGSCSRRVQSPPGYPDGIIVTPRSLHDTPPPDDPLLADKRFCRLPGRAFGDGSLSRQRANRAYLCLLGDLREETPTGR